MGDVRRWSPGGLTAVADLLVTRCATLVGLQDELDATVTPGHWVGNAADTAYASRGEITEGLRRLVAQTQAVRGAVDETADAVTAVQQSLREADELAARGHSFGSTTLGYALQHGTGVDDAVFYGSPGLGTSNTNDLQVPDGHVYVEGAHLDPVAGLGRFGPVPGGLDGVTTLSTDTGTSPDGLPRTGVSGHTSYTNDGTMSQYNMAVIAAGLPELGVPTGAGGGS